MKKLLTVSAVVLMVLTFSLSAKALEPDFENLDESISEELMTSVDKDVISALKEMGIDPEKSLDVSGFSLDSITAFFASTLKEKAEECISEILTLLCVILLCGTVSSLFVGYKNGNFITQMSVIILILMSSNMIGEALSASVSVIKLNGNFMLSFIPVYTLVISLSGNTASALTYNSLIMAFAETFSSVIAYALPELIGVLLCLIIAFSLNEGISISRLTNAVNKTVSVVLGASAGAFTGFLSLKNILSVSLEGVSVKSIRFLISSLIPVIGSSISEAYSSLIGSINLIKGSVAIVGIVIILIINLPVLAQLFIYYISFTALSYLSDSFSVVRVGETLRGISCAMRILMLLSIFEMFILVISTGIMLSVRSTL